MSGRLKKEKKYEMDKKHIILSNRVGLDLFFSSRPYTSSFNPLLYFANCDSLQFHIILYPPEKIAFLILYY